MGDGSARRTVKAPGYLDPAAEPFDARVATALAAGDAGALAGLDPAEGERLLAAGVPDLAGGRRRARRAHVHRPAAPRRRAVRGRLPGRRLDGRMSAPPPVVAVVGPTATGKTALAVALAQRLGGEVVNADSMQLYRGMDIGTAKPDLAERGGVPHHLLDLWHVRRGRLRRRVPRAGAGRDRPAARRPGSCRCWSAAPGSTCAPSSTSWSSPAPMPTSGRGCEGELAAVGAGRPARAAGRARPGARPRPCSRATDGGSCAPWRSSSSPAGRSAPRCPSRARTTRSSPSAWTGNRRSSTSGSPSGWSACGPPASSPRSRRWPPTACARGRRRRARSATRRCSRSSTGR